MEHYIVGTIEEREFKNNALMGVRFRIKRNAGVRHSDGQWEPGQPTKPGDVPELSYIFEMTEDEAEGLMINIGIKLKNIRKERNEQATVSSGTENHAGRSNPEGSYWRKDGNS